MNKKKSQISEVIHHLRKHKTITSMEAIKRYGATRLSGIIYILRKRGFIISTETKTVKNRYDNPSQIAVYHLEKDCDYE